MNNKRQSGWWVTGWTRPRPGSPEPETRNVTDNEGRSWRLTEQDDPQYVEQGAQVIDQEAGITYRASIGRTPTGRPFLTSLQIEAPKVDSRLLAAVPADRIADAVGQFLDARARAGADEFVILPPAAVQGRGFVPDLDELAERLRASSKRGQREALIRTYMTEYGVSRATVYRWVAAARDGHDDLQPTTGRGHRAPSTERKQQ